jgi:hypothetical protein
MWINGLQPESTKDSPKSLYKKAYFHWGPYKRGVGRANKKHKNMNQHGTNRTIRDNTIDRTCVTIRHDPS